MSRLTRTLVKAASSPSPWDLGNRVLYDLCRKHQRHRDVPSILAKVWLIGRSYAVAIERRKTKSSENDDFYLSRVAPVIRRSGIDRWIDSLSMHRRIDATSMNAVLAVHGKVTELFSRISGLQNRSLASKYLHFHRPDLFYLYDTRAVAALRTLTPIVGRASRGGDAGGVDSEYRKLVEKCSRLTAHVRERFGVRLTPRQVDNLLLRLHGDGVG
jgi:hypothetical protein